MENRFELAFDDVLAANQSGKTRNLLITDNNDEFRNSALKALYHWSEKNSIRVVEIDEDDESWMDLIPLLELYKQLNTVKTVLLVKNYATYLFRSSNPNTARSFIRNIALERSYTKDSSTSLELPNLLFVIAINDLSEMYWKEAEYSSFSIIHEDEDKCTWVNTKFTRPDTQMHPVMTRVNKAIYFVSDDETTICIDVGEAFKGVRLKNPIRSLRPTLEAIFRNFIIMWNA